MNQEQNKDKSVDTLLEENEYLSSLHELLREEGFSLEEAGELITIEQEYINSSLSLEEKINKKVKLIPRRVPIRCFFRDAFLGDWLRAEWKEVVYQYEEGHLDKKLRDWGFQEHTLKVGKIRFLGKLYYTGLYVYGIERQDKEWLSSGYASEEEGNLKEDDWYDTEEPYLDFPEEKEEDFSGNFQIVDEP